MIDKFGQKTMVVIFTSCNFIGQCIVSFGCTARHFHAILLGRFIFGFGESLNISLITILSSYFAQGELALAVIILFLFTRFCTFLNLLLSPILELEHGVPVAFWTGSLICIISVVAALILAEVDDALKSPYSSMKHEGRSNLNIGRGTYGSSNSWLVSQGVFRHVKSSMNTNKPSIPSRLPVVMEEEDSSPDAEMGCLAGNIKEDLHVRQEKCQYGTFYNRAQDSGVVACEESIIEADACPSDSSGTWPKFSERSLLCLFFLCFFLYGAILPFLDMANPIIHIGYFQGRSFSDYEREIWVTRLQSIPIVLLAVVAPCVAVAVDYYGHRPLFFVLASALLTFSHGIIAAKLGDLSYLVVALVLIGVAHA